eukprot:TRINITY_DN38917_c0_g1_i1.p1 TRINITY_DN38917_c0_g1~~TRINITY_DN38917_c0_g1_i1.p1  ORF type:complete len:177 (-),score=6.33 TRINITY_DN38917_c0_g1_i1:89-619(-)
MAQAWYGLVFVLSLHGRGYRVKTAKNDKVDAPLKPGTYSVNSNDFYFCCFHKHGRSMGVECGEGCDGASLQPARLVYDTATKRILSRSGQMCVGYDVRSKGSIGKAGTGKLLSPLKINGPSAPKCITFEVSQSDTDKFVLRATNFTLYRFFCKPKQDPWVYLGKYSFCSFRLKSQN